MNEKEGNAEMQKRERKESEREREGERRDTEREKSGREKIKKKTKTGKILGAIKEQRDGRKEIENNKERCKERLKPCSEIQNALIKPKKN